MPNITVHFATESGADAEALAKTVEEEIEAVPAVETADAEVMRSRSIDPLTAMTTIVTVIQYAPTVIDGATKIIQSLTKLAQQSQAFRSVIVEIGGRKIPVAQLKPSDLAETR